MKIVPRTLRFLVVPGLSLSLLGCPPVAEKVAPDATTKTEQATSAPEKTDAPAPQPTAKPPVRGDDPESVKALQAAGVVFKLDAAGQVIAADCKNAEITDEQLPLFRGLPGLKVLSFENSQITNKGLEILEHLPQLVELGLRRCTNVNDEGLAALRFLPNLQRLMLLFTNTTSEGLKHVAPLHHLKVLDLRGCMQVGDPGLVHLEGLTKLVDLKFRSYSVTDAGMKSVGKLKKLRVLSLEDCGVGNTGMAELASLKDLKILNVMRTVVGDKGLSNFADMGLTHLTLRDTAVTGVGLDSLEAAKSTLIDLDLSETRISNDGVAHIAPFTKLQSLNLWNGSLDDEGLKVLADLKELKELNLEGCREITSSSAEQISKYPKLEILNISETGFDDSGLESLNGMKTLKLINVARSGITDDAAKKFEADHPGCKVKL